MSKSMHFTGTLTPYRCYRIYVFGRRIIGVMNQKSRGVGQQTYRVWKPGVTYHCDCHHGFVRCLLGGTARLKIIISIYCCF